ncbi:MAG: hypothetical protein ACOYEW_07240 [Anaerolineae bacterium]|jgi:hypothetical protein
MQYKEDWEQAQKRIEAWWVGEIIDRPCLQVTAPRAGWEQQRNANSVPAGVSVEEWWTDVEATVERTARRIEATFYGGEAFPLFNPNLGPDLFAAYLGAPLRFLDTHTNWVQHIITDWADFPELKISEDNRWWRLQIELLQAAHEAGRGRWITGMPDTHAGGDALSALRGNDRLCMDLYDNPEPVRRALDELVRAVTFAYDRYFSIVEADKYGSSSGWLPSWCPGRSNAVQCDFIALISPAQMEEFILPSIVAEARLLDRVVFHLDGPDAIRHLDLLMAVPEIHAIQWVPGAAGGMMTDWIPLLQRIQAGGKSLHLSTTAAEVPTLLEALRPEGLMISTHTDTEEDARALLASISARS